MKSTNREMDLRAWDGCDMYYLSDGYHITFWDAPKKVKFGVYRNDDDTMISKEDRGMVVMWWSGLLDKNKKNIYEGDIRVAEYFVMNDPTKCIQVLEFDNNMACFYWRSIIGGEWPSFIQTEIEFNIYENPELLKNEKE